jgi:hypothetical protein
MSFVFFTHSPPLSSTNILPYSSLFHPFPYAFPYLLPLPPSFPPVFPISSTRSSITCTSLLTHFSSFSPFSLPSPFPLPWFTSPKHRGRIPFSCAWRLQRLSLFCGRLDNVLQDEVSSAHWWHWQPPPQFVQITAHMTTRHKASHIPHWRRRRMRARWRNCATP